MRPEHEAGVQLDTFHRPLAQGVVTVLRRYGIRAWTKDGVDTGGETAVFVPEGSRESAFATLTAAMEEVREAAEHPQRLAEPRPARAPRGELEDEPGPPIVMERIRRMGFITVLLAPLLVVTLAAPGMPMALALTIYVGGLVLLTAWRRREEDE